MRASHFVLGAIAAPAFAAVASAGLSSFTFPLSGDQEVPPVATDASGTATLVYDSDNKTFDLDVVVSGIELGDLLNVGPNSTPIHLHNAPAGSNGGIVIDVGFFADFVQDGDDIRLTLDDAPFGGMQGAIDTDPQANEAALFAQELYLNIHTSDFGAGEIRGQVVPAPAGASVLALAGLGAMRRRRR